MSGFDVLLVLFFFAIAITVGIIAQRQQRRRRATVAATLDSAEARDAQWDADALRKRVSEVFAKFQAAWSTLDAKVLDPLLTESYRKRMVLELAVLAAEHRRNMVGHPKILRLEIAEASDAADDRADTFTAEIEAQSRDALVDHRTGRELFVDESSFTEYWVFRREDGTWQLDRIRQSTEAPDFRESAIAAFAERHGFFYDPDFGWLMMPNEGFLFRRSNFKTSDINNHVIGYHREKVVELYTYRANPEARGDRGVVVAQAILPKAYHDIVIRKRGWWSGVLGPRGLRRVTLESPEFNRRFMVWAHPLDQANSFELLHPTFMEKVSGLAFPVDIEVVGNFLYLATASRGGAEQFEEMLGVLNWAFDELEK